MRGLRLTATEQERVRVAVRGLRLRVGTQGALATLLGVTHRTVQNVLCGRAVSGRTWRVADVLGVSIDDLTDGRYHPPGPCPYCGRDDAAGVARARFR